MLFIIFQEDIFRLSPLFVLIPLYLITVIIVFKIGLLIVKARERKSIYFVIISVFAQIGTIFLLFIPILLFGVAENWNMSYAPQLTLFIILALFIDFNLINILHKLGLQRTAVVFLFFVIPTLIFGILIGNTINNIF